MLLNPPFAKISPAVSKLSNAYETVKKAPTISQAEVLMKADACIKWGTRAPCGTCAQPAGRMRIKLGTCASCVARAHHVSRLINGEAL